MPGVAAVDFRIGKQIPTPGAEIDEHLFRVQINDEVFGFLIARLNRPDAFEPYRSYVGNLCFMMAAVLQQHRRTEVERDRQQELERRVGERTKQLAQQVVETQAAMGQLNEEKLRARHYLEVSEAIIVELDAEGDIAVINQRGAELLGWTSEELIGKNWFEIALPEESVDSIKELFRQGISGDVDPVEYYENEIQCRDGSSRFVVWHNVVRRNSEGKVFRMLCSGTDVTLRKRMETALAEEKERLAVTLRSIADGVIATDNTGMIRTLNRAAEEVTGWSSNDAVGKPLADVYRLEPIGSKESLVPLDDRQVGQWKLKSEHAGEIIVSHRASPIYDHDSRKIGTVIVFRDITRQFEMREQMERIARLDSIGVLAGGIAHDFNNLLSGLFGYLEMAAESESISEIRTYLEKSNAVYERARNLTGQLLTFAKGGAPVLEVGDLGKVVRDAATFALSGSNVGSSFEIEEKLWPVAFDANQMSQVVDNVVINAKQAMERSGQIRIVVSNLEMESGRVATLRAGKYVQVSIQDSGPGIPPSMIQRIFDPFFTTRKNGTGLGLATSFSILQRHGGAIDVRSEVDRGTTVFLYLPITGELMKSVHAPEEIQHEGKGTVLILDDEPFIRDIGSRMLKSMGYEVMCFETGDEVINYIQQLSEEEIHQIVAAMFDLTIPGGTGGAEIIGRVRALVGDIVIFAVSGYSAGDVMSTPAAYGFTDSLPKPYRKKDLARLLEKHQLSRS